MLPENAAEALCSFLFLFCSPAVTFSNILNAEISEIFNLSFFLAVTAYEGFLFILFFLVYRKGFHMEGSAAVIRDLIAMYGNISYVGIPVFLVLFDNAIPNVITLLIHGIITSPIIIFLLDWYSGEEHDSNVFKSILISLRNPNIFVPITAAILLMLKVKVPEVILDTASLLGTPTTAIGMFALGLSCSKNIRRGISWKIFGEAFLGSVCKLVICPLTAWVFGRFLFGLEGWWLTALVVLAMLPSALNDYILAQRYHAEEDYACIGVLMSTLLFSITISLYIQFIGL